LPTSSRTCSQGPTPWSSPAPPTAAPPGRLRS
jgi:hypothetical protein